MKASVIAAALACGLLGMSPAHAGPCAVLTFDDGPSPHTTPQLLDTLKKYGVHVTFFVIGENVKQWPDIVRRMQSEGHEVENHSWNHPKPFEALSRDVVVAQFQRADAAILAATGTTPKLVRIPGGAKSRAISEALGSRPRIDWDVDPDDWRHHNTAYVTRYVLDHTHQAAIVLMHDIHKTSVDAVPAIIEGLRSRGYSFVTVEQFRAGACGH